MFIMSLAIADLTVGMIVMPISSAYAITGDWMFGIVVCQFWLSADYSASTASILNLLILSLDRYWSIRSPLKYMRKRTKKRALIMIAFVWLLSSMWIIPIIGWHYWYNDGIRKQPSNVCETEFADNVLFKLSTSIANFYVPMVLMIVIYVKIFHEIKKRSKFEIGQCNVGGSGSRTSSTQDVRLGNAGLFRNAHTRSFREVGNRYDSNVYSSNRSFRYNVPGDRNYPSSRRAENHVRGLINTLNSTYDEHKVYSSSADTSIYGNCNCTAKRRNRLDVPNPDECSCFHSGKAVTAKSPSGDNGRDIENLMKRKLCCYSSSWHEIRDRPIVTDEDVHCPCRRCNIERTCQKCNPHLKQHDFIYTSHGVPYPSNLCNTDCSDSHCKSEECSEHSCSSNSTSTTGIRCRSLHTLSKVSRNSFEGCGSTNNSKDSSLFCGNCGSVKNCLHHIDCRKFIRQCSDDGRFQHNSLLCRKHEDGDAICFQHDMKDISIKVECVQNGKNAENSLDDYEFRAKSNVSLSQKRPEEVIVIANDIGEGSSMSTSTLSLSLQKSPHGSRRCILKSWLSKGKRWGSCKGNIPDAENASMELDEISTSCGVKKSKRSKKKHRKDAAKSNIHDIHLKIPLQKYTSHTEVSETDSARSSFRSGASFRGGTRILSNFSTLRMKVTRRGLTTSLKQEKKAARQLGVIMSAFVLCWLPYIILFIVTAYCEDCLNPNIHTAAIWLGYFNSTMNPFLYALCNANFKRAFKKMFRRGSKNDFYATNASAKTDHLFA